MKEAKCNACRCAGPVDVNIDDVEAYRRTCAGQVLVAPRVSSSGELELGGAGFAVFYASTDGAICCGACASHDTEVAR